jgi:hypothetical protein
MANRLPGEQAALGTGEKSMREGGVDTAAIEVHNLGVLIAGEDNTPVESVAALEVDETGALQRFQGVALIREMAPQISAGGIADSEFFDQAGTAHAALFEIAARFQAMRMRLVNPSFPV